MTFELHDDQQCAEQIEELEPEQVTSRRALLTRGGAALAGAAGLSLAATTTFAPAASATTTSTSPTGPAGGGLSGNYPSPGISATSLITDSMVVSSAGIGEQKIALTHDAAWATASRRSIGSGQYQTVPGHLPLVAEVTGTNYSISTTTITAIDAMNLSLTFNVPDTGAVLVTLQGVIAVTGSTQYVGYAILETMPTAGVPTGAFGIVTNSTTYMRQPLPIRVSGLCPGSQHTWQWAWYLLGGTPTASLITGSGWGYATMTIARCL